MVSNKCVIILLVLSLFVDVMFCQTFQYSRGWTNGKRSDMYGGVAKSVETSNLINDDGFTGNDVRKLKLLLHGEADEMQPMLVHCEIVDKRKSMRMGGPTFQPRHERGQAEDSY